MITYDNVASEHSQVVHLNTFAELRDILEANKFARIVVFRTELGWDVTLRWKTKYDRDPRIADNTRDPLLDAPLV